MFISTEMCLTKNVNTPVPFSFGIIQQSDEQHGCKCAASSHLHKNTKQSCSGSGTLYITFRSHKTTDSLQPHHSQILGFVVSLWEPSPNTRVPQDILFPARAVKAPISAESDIPQSLILLHSNPAFSFCTASKSSKCSPLVRQQRGSVLERNEFLNRVATCSLHTENVAPSCQSL